MKKGTISLVVIILLTLSAIAFLFYNLETYYAAAHVERSLPVCGYAILISLITGFIYVKRKDSFPAYKTVCAVCAVLLFLVLLLGRQIPFCVECGGTTAEELGILKYWITPFEEIKP